MNKIKKPQTTYVFIDQNRFISGKKGSKYYLSVTTNGNTKLMQITKQVAEVLVARGMTYGT